MKTSSHRGVKAPKGEVTKVNVSLSTQAYRRLFVTSVMSGRTASSLIEELIESHLRNWSMPGELVARGKKNDRLESADQISQPIAEAA